MLKRILFFLKKFWLNLTEVKSQPVEDCRDDECQKNDINFKKVKGLSSSQSLIFEIKYSLNLSNRDISNHLKQFYIVGLNGTPRGYGDISFVHQILKMNEVTGCEYAGYGNFKIRKAVFAEWEVLLPKVREVIYKYIRQKVV